MSVRLYLIREDKIVWSFSHGEALGILGGSWHLTKW